MPRRRTSKFPRIARFWQAARSIAPGFPWRVFRWLAAAATLVISPFFYLGNASGHDFEFHLESWMEVVEHWHQWVFYPRWAEWANYGYGEPRFIFYPPLSWLAGGALGLVLPWDMVPGAFIWIVLVLAGLNAYRLAKMWLGEDDARLAAVLYAVNPYHLVIVYYRSDFAELLASALLPLLLCGVIELARRGWPRLPFFVAIYALIWLSNAPAAVISTYLIAVIVAAQYLQERSPQILLRAMAGGAMSLSLIAFYIFPAWYEQRWVNINGALSMQLLPWNNFLFAHADDPEFVLFNWKVSGVAILVLALFGISAVFAARYRNERREVFWPLLATGLTAVVLMFPATKLIWADAPELKFVQFPWRWLLPLDLVAAMFFAAAVARLKRRWIPWTAIFLCVATLAGWMMTNNWWDSLDATYLSVGITRRIGYEGTDEYVPNGCDRYSLPARPADMAGLDAATEGPIINSPFRTGIQRWDAESRIIRVHVDHPTLFLVRLFPYPGWGATVNGAPAQIEEYGDAGQAMVRIPAGRSRIDLRFARTWDRTTGDIVSTIALVAVLWLRRRWRRVESTV
jgi:hypothetical protein